MLPGVRETLATTRKEAFESLANGVRGDLKLSLPPEPDYDTLPTRSQQRLGYLESFRTMRRYHNEAMMNLALMFLIWSILLGPQLLAQDMRQDLKMADLLPIFCSHTTTKSPSSSQATEGTSESVLAVSLTRISPPRADRAPAARRTTRW